MKNFYRCKNGFVECREWEPYCWISIEVPQPEDYAMLSRDFHVPLEYLEYVADRDENPRIERDHDWLLAIIRVPVRSQSSHRPFTTVPLGVIVNGEIVLTVCYRHTEMIPDFIEHTRIKSIEIHSAADFILRLVYSATFWYHKYLAQINATVDETEKHLERSVHNDDILTLMKMQKSLTLFNTAISGNTTMLSRLKSIFAKDLDSDLLEDVEIELSQAAKTADIYSSILGNTMDAFGSVISNNANDVMKRLTSVSIVLMVPTLIASFYGMNVQITLSENPAAFWIIIGMAAVLTGVCWWLFKKLGWL